MNRKAIVVNNKVIVTDEDGSIKKIVDYNDNIMESLYLENIIEKNELVISLLEKQLDCIKEDTLFNNSLIPLAFGLISPIVVGAIVYYGLGINLDPVALTHSELYDYLYTVRSISYFTIPSSIVFIVAKVMDDKRIAENISYMRKELIKNKRELLENKERYNQIVNSKEFVNNPGDFTIYDINNYKNNINNKKEIKK